MQQSEIISAITVRGLIYGGINLGGENTMKVLDAETINALGLAAQESPRRRTAHVIHDESADPVQRMVMIAEPDTYVGPHRHPDKAWEMMILLSGAMDVLFFSEDGILNDRVPLRMDGTRLVEYAADSFHAAVILERHTMVFEVKDGPYDAATAKQLPDWAPVEGSDDADGFNVRMRTLHPRMRA